MSTFTSCADNLVCATLSGSNGIGVGLVTGTPNKIVVSASNIPNSSLANSAININGVTVSLGSTGSLAIGDITDVNAGTNLVGGGDSGSLTIALTSSITGGLNNISGTTNIVTSNLTASSISSTNYEGIYPYDASTISVLRNIPDNKPYWSVITEDMVVKVITVSMTANGGTQREIGTNIVNPSLSITTVNETPSYAHLTNTFNGENLNILSNFAGGNSATATSAVTYSGSAGVIGSVGGILTYTVTVKSTLSPSVTKTANASYYWGRYMYWGTDDVDPFTNPAINELFVKNLKSSQNNSYGLVNNLGGMNSVLTYGKTFNNIPTVKYVYVAYPNILNSSPSGFKINGVEYKIANADVKDLGTVLVSRENDSLDPISYRVLGSKSLTADTNNTQTFYVF
jgi:hypothetical protein